MERTIDITSGAQDLRFAATADSLIKERGELNIRIKELEDYKTELNDRIMNFLCKEDYKSIRSHFGTITFVDQIRKNTNTTKFKEELLRLGVDPKVISQAFAIATTEAPSMYVKYTASKETI